MTDSKTATERLREMLDARGVEWCENGCPDLFYDTNWKFAKGSYASFTEAVETWPSQQTILYLRNITPEQAIAATLGSNAKPCYATDYTHEHCKYSVNRGWLEDTKFYIPTPDTLWSGECEFVIEDNMNETEGMGDVWFRCTSCDTCFDYYADEWLMKMNYCPNCGKAVKR